MHELKSWFTFPHSFNEHNSQCVLYTYKEGLLSAIAHDLKIKISRFDINIDAEQHIQARFWPDTCEVLGAVDADGNLIANALKTKDLKQIKKNLQKDVLKTNKYPVIQFQGQVQQQSVVGHLEIQKQKQNISHQISVQSQANQVHISATFTLKPSQWGIAPYKALLGAIRLQDKVVLQWSCTHLGK